MDRCYMNLIVTAVAGNILTLNSDITLVKGAVLKFQSIEGVLEMFEASILRQKEPTDILDGSTFEVKVFNEENRIYLRESAISNR